MLGKHAMCHGVELREIEQPAENGVLALTASFALHAPSAPPAAPLGRACSPEISRS
jgi:hypothetical protein